MHVLLKIFAMTSIIYIRAGAAHVLLGFISYVIADKRKLQVSISESIIFFTSANEVVFSSTLVCLFVRRITQQKKNYSTDFHKMSVER